ncbi:DNA primase [Candidatus Margulisiibacteriota bacterium]
MNFKQKIEEVRNKIDIIDLISGYVQLKKRGKNYLGLCPFHSEKTASFNVSQEKGLFHCFGCGEGGNSFDFVMKIEKVDFMDALKILGDKVGIPIEKNLIDPKKKNERDRLYGLLKTASKYFQDNLNTEITAEIKKRGLNDESIAQFQLGFARDGWDNLLNFMVGRGYSPADLERVGLVIKKEGKNDYYDRFRNRIVFPVFDKRDRVIGFSGRAVAELQPKYLNSPDSSIFHKGETLFGINFAQNEIKSNKFALLVEGNVDLLLCHQFGFKNAVAPLGTAFTGAQATLLKRLTDQVLLVFDGDRAGLAAAMKAANILSAIDIKVKIATLPEKSDPADLLTKNGKDSFIKIIKAALPALEFKIREIVKRFKLDTIEGKATAIEKAAQVLSQENNNLIQKEYTIFAANLLNSDFDTITSEVKRHSFYKGKKAHYRQPITKPASKLIEAEKRLIKIGLSHPEKIKEIKNNLPERSVSDSEYAAILDQLINHPKLSADEFKSEEQKKIVRAILFEELPLDNIDQTIGDCVATLKNAEQQIKSEKIRLDIKKAEAEEDLEGLKKLQNEFAKLYEISKAT